MKTLFSLSIVFLSLALLSLSPGSTKAKWSKYQHANTGIRVSFPSSYTEEAEPKQDEYQTTKATCELNNVLYFVGITEHQIELPEPEELEEVSLQSFTETTEGKIIDRKSWKYKKEMGIEATIDISESEILYRVLIIDQKQIQLVIAYPKESKPSKKMIKKFFKSFKG